MSTKGIFASLKRSGHISRLVLSIILLASPAWTLFTESVACTPLLDTLQTSANSPELLFTDLDRDGTVNILDLEIIAVAFGSYPGHSKWNPSADLDHDDKITILDITLVARDFGKIAEKSISLKRYTASGSFENFSAETIAELFDMSQSYPSSGVRIQQVHQIRPDYIALLYRNFPIVYWYADELDLFKNRGWILKDAQGDFVRSKSLPYYWIDFGDPSCQAWVADWVKHYLDEYGFDGVFADNSLAATADHWFWDVEARPINPRTGTYWTDAEIVEAELAYHICVKQAIGSRLLICNGIWVGERFYEYQNTYAYIVSSSPLDGYMSEGIWYKYDGEWLSEEQWKKSLDFLVWTQETGRIFIPACSVGDGDKILPSSCSVQQMYTYALASTLLGIETNRNYLGSRGTVDFFRQITEPLHSIVCGEPTNNYYVIDGTRVYARDFTKVKVLVNPSDEAYSVILNKDYETLDGQVVSSVRMEPHSGLLLKNPRLLVLNPSVEEDANDDDIPDQWEGGGDDELAPSVEWSDQPNTGRRSLFVSIEPNTSAPRWYIAGLKQSFNTSVLRPGHTYKFRCWHKSNVTIRLFAVYWDSSHNWIRNAEMQVPTSGEVWKQAEWLIFTVPESAHVVAVGAGLFNGDIGQSSLGWTYLDDFELYETSNK